MSARLETSPDGEFKLSGVLDFESVPVVWRRHRHLLETSKQICIDLSGVEHSNSAGIALLLDWQRHAAGKNIKLEYSSMPAQMVALAQVSGVLNLLELAE